MMPEKLKLPTLTILLTLKMMLEKLKLQQSTSFQKEIRERENAVSELQSRMDSQNDDKAWN